MPVLVLLATEAERDAALAGLPDATPAPLGPYDGMRAGPAMLLVSGVGPAAAGAAAGAALALAAYDGVVSLGVGGGFAGRAEPGSAVVATACVAADLGADAPEGFLDLAALGWGEPARPTCLPARQAAAERLAAHGLPVTLGPVLTVSTVTGTAARARWLAQRYEPAAEAMEGWGVAEAAVRHGVAFLEVRTVSNTVGPRERERWRLGAALQALTTAAGAVLTEELPWRS